MLKTTLTPAEHANVVQGMPYPVALNGINVGAITATVKNSFIADQKMAIRNLRTAIGTCGTAGSTVVEVKKNGVLVASTTTAHDEPDGTAKTALPVSDTLASVEPGDIVLIEVTTAPTNGALLHSTVHLDRRFE